MPVFSLQQCNFWGKKICEEDGCAYLPAGQKAAAVQAVIAAGDKAAHTKKRREKIASSFSKSSNLFKV